MIYELATLSSFIFLILTFIINTYQISLIKEIKINEEGLSQYIKKINIIKTTITIFIIFLLISKLMVLLFGPDTLLNEFSFSSSEILILVVNFFYAVLWFMIVLFLYQSQEIKQEFILDYLKKISYSITLVFFLDFLLEGIVYLTTISEYMSLSVFTIVKKMTDPYPDLLYLIVLIVILTALLSGLFISFLVKRNIKILRYLELATLLLLFAIGYLVFFGTSAIVGWNESLIYLLKLFSFDYGYTGFIFIIVLAVTLITNSSVVLLFNLKEFFNSEQQLKNRLINMVKVGFVATCILSCMAVWPHIYLWF
ncbi:MAG: hypothetical protein KAT05_17355 [Spirochaetes bacterium]|nr:hypothetical protein [Spirochaetota bacterium]